MCEARGTATSSHERSQRALQSQARRAARENRMEARALLRRNQDLPRVRCCRAQRVVRSAGPGISSLIAQAQPFLFGYF